MGNLLFLSWGCDDNKQSSFSLSLTLSYYVGSLLGSYSILSFNGQEYYLHPTHTSLKGGGSSYNSAMNTLLSIISVVVLAVVLSPHKKIP